MASHPIIDQLEKEQLRQDIPQFNPGDTVRVEVRVVEGDKSRLQAFEGNVIAKRNRGLNSSFTVRKISSGEGVERVFQTHSPLIASIKVVTYVALSSTTYATVLVRLLASARRSKDRLILRSRRVIFVVSTTTT